MTENENREARKKLDEEIDQLNKQADELRAAMTVRGTYGWLSRWADAYKRLEPLLRKIDQLEDEYTELLGDYED